MIPEEISLPIVSSLRPVGASSVVAPMLSTNVGRPTHLVLHLDINETVVLGDRAGGDSFQHSVQKMLAKSAFCQIPPSHAGPGTQYENSEPTHWWDGQEIGKEECVPPLYTGWIWPENCCPYYRTKYKKVSKTFVEHHGKIYCDLQRECEKHIPKPKSGSDHAVILPALFHTLDQQMKKRASDLTVVFRTLGSDLPVIAQAVTEFARGQHPDYPNVDYSSLVLDHTDLYQARWRCEKETGAMVYELWDLDETKLVASGDEEVLEIIHRSTICGIRDSYDDWADNNWLPSSGKPVWKLEDCGNSPEQTRHFHHILFDDNIHNIEDDGIACIRAKGPDGYATLSHDEMQRYQGIHLVRVPTVEVVLNKSWFNEMIDRAQFLSTNKVSDSDN